MTISARSEVSPSPTRKTLIPFVVLVVPVLNIPPDGISSDETCSVVSWVFDPSVVVPLPSVVVSDEPPLLHPARLAATPVALIYFMRRRRLSGPSLLGSVPRFFWCESLPGDMTSSSDC